MKYNQKLPKNVEKQLDDYIQRIKDIKWFQPSQNIKREDIDKQINISLEAFGVKASIEYRTIKTVEDWDAARGAAWDAARDAAWDAAMDAAEDAAMVAAMDAARSAIVAAAGDAEAALQPTVTMLQTSALELLDRMIDPSQNTNTRTHQHEREHDNHE